MATFLLVLIYLAFISLGLPDSVIGVSWPIMQQDLNVSLDFGGYISLIITLGTIASSLLSGHLIEKLGTGKIIVLSIFLTSFALFGYSISNSYVYIILFALPLGFGAGSIDTALNNYVALHYKPHHMNWLHSFWGVGATIGPAIMTIFLLENDWQKGFLVIAMIQFVIMILLTFSLPLWNDKKEVVQQTDEVKVKPKKKSIRKIKGVYYALFIFLIYCALEFSLGIWGSSYLVLTKGILASKAASIITIYYLGITSGRFISGMLTFFLSNSKLIFGGITLVFIGALLLFIVKDNTLLILSFGIVGFGLAPIFPSMIHDTPKNFGEENSQYIIGYQIAFAYIGSAIFPSIFGILYSYISITLFPLTIFLLACTLLILIIVLKAKTLKHVTHK